jgi:hypothetical protein
MARFDDITEVESFSGTEFARKVTCKLCASLVYEINENSTQPEILIEVNRIKFHMNLHHGIVVKIANRNDPKCGEKH